MGTILIDKLLQAVRQAECQRYPYDGRAASRVSHRTGGCASWKPRCLEPEDTVALMKSITPERCQQELQEVGGADFGFAFGDLARFRVSIFKQRGNIGMVLRQIPNSMLIDGAVGFASRRWPICAIARGVCFW